MLSNIKAELKNELTERNYEWSDFAINKIVEEWYAQKKPLIDLLSKHPNWNPEKFMIQFDTNYSRKIDVCTTRDFLNWLWGNTNIQQNLYLDMSYCLVEHTYLQEDAIDTIEAINNLHESFRFRPGMKVTKVMRKICEHYGWTKITSVELDRNRNEVTYNAFEREFAKYCDAISPIKVTRHTCISLNPLDYLLMSNGNSWRSCHYIDYADYNPGEYSSGTISYMLDEHSIVFYTVDASNDGNNIELAPKTQRQIFGYNDFQIMQSRMYPQSNDYGAAQIYEDFRNVMQKVIADCLEKPNLWIRSTHKLNTFHGPNATCYPDWSYDSNDLYSTSVLREKKGVDLQAIILGAEPICIQCGYRHHEPENINCCALTNYCAGCGTPIHSEEDEYYVDGELYCQNCVQYCDCCEEYTREKMYYIPSEGRYVCEFCLSEHYVQCYVCENWIRYDHAIYAPQVDAYVDEDCFDLYWETCEKCGEIYNRRELELVEDKNGELHYYCHDCMEGENDDE